MLDRLKQVRAGVLDVGYVEVGAGHGQAVQLLHGWPYDMPYLRGYGTIG
jgi:hypothetical protein